MYENEYKEIELLNESIARMERQCRDEGRQPLPIERDLMKDMKDKVNEIEMSLPQKTETVIGPQAGLYSGSGTSRDISTDDGGFKNVGDIMAALYRKSNGEGFDKRLKPLQIRAAIGETVPSEGGFAIPLQFVERALNENLMDTVLLQLCDRQIMTKESMTIPAFQDDSHNATAPFGITWSQIAEGESFGTMQGTPFRSLQLAAKKSGALFLVNNEWLSDSSSGIRQRLENVWRASLRWYIEDLLWVGTGAGQALGALVGGGAVSIEIETGQNDGTIQIENVVQMWSRLRPGSHSRAIWACNASCFPALATLSLSVGTGGGACRLVATGQRYRGTRGDNTGPASPHERALTLHREFRGPGAPRPSSLPARRPATNYAGCFSAYKV